MRDLRLLRRRRAEGDRPRRPPAPPDARPRPRPRPRPCARPRPRPCARPCARPRHAHDHDHDHDHDHGHEHGHGHEPVTTRTISFEQDVLARNSLLAERNRGWFDGRGILALNLMSSPGSGKTTLLERTIRDLGPEVSISVVEGDQETLLDAERIRADRVLASSRSTPAAAATSTPPCSPTACDRWIRRISRWS